MLQEHRCRLIIGKKLKLLAVSGCYASEGTEQRVIMPVMLAQIAIIKTVKRNNASRLWGVAWGIRPGFGGAYNACYRDKQKGGWVVRWW